MSVELIWKHQQKAYELMKESLKENKKAAYIFPTGCGKTFPALKYIEENPEKRVLLVSPSQGINNQFRKYVNRYVENGERRLRNENIRIQTYQKKALERKRDIKGIKSIEDKKFTEQAPDIIIFDEIHRMGAETWEVAIDDLMRRYPNAEVIGMTATPERTDKRNMAYEKFGDNVVYEMSLTEALSGEKEGEVVLQTPRYVRVLSELKGQLAEYREQIELIDDEEKRIRLQRKFEKLDTIVSNSPDIEDIMVAGMQKKNGKYIVFCKDREDMLDKMNRAQEIFGKVNQNIHTEYVLSKNEAGDTIGKTNVQNREALENFENKENGEELNLLFCVDKLNEGVHIEGIDGEVLFDLTESEILYKQRIGRVLSVDKKAGEAVIIDASNNWLNHIETYREIEAAIQKGGIRENKGLDYDLLQLTAEETDLLNIMLEIGEELRYNRYKTYEEVIEWLETHDGKLMQSGFKSSGRYLTVKELTLEQKKEMNLYARWIKAEERKVLEKYAGEPIECVPEEYREKIAKLREFGLGKKEKTAYEEVIKWLEIHNGKMPRGKIKKNGINLVREQMTEEEQEEVNLYSRWLKTEERKLLEKYLGREIGEIPEEYREKIEALRKYGFGLKEEKTTYEEIIEWLEEHEGQMPRSNITKNRKQISRKELTPEQKEEINLYQRWYKTEERKILEEYAGEAIESVPEAYKERIAKLREFGLGEKEKTVYEEIIKWLEEHEGKMPRSTIQKNGIYLVREQMTEEEQEEVNLYARWQVSKERKTLEEYARESIENVPKEYRAQISKLRSYGLGLSKKTAYEEIIEWLEGHEGQMPIGAISRNGKQLKIEKMTKEEQEEVNLYGRWKKCEERKILDEYVGREIEEIPQEYRAQISKLRSYGLGLEENTYEKIIAWLEEHEEKIPRGAIKRKGKQLLIEEMTEEEQEEVKLYGRWKHSEERKILNEYAGAPIENVPEEYREKIAKLRSLGQFGKKKDDKIKSRMKNAVSSSVKNNIETRKELETEREQNLNNDGYHGFLDE